MKTARSARTPRRPQAGFTLIELLITLLVVAEILIIAGLIFDLHNKTARAQGHVADMQQSLRVAQREMVEAARMAGRGGLPANLPPPPATAASVVDGLAVEVDNNVTAGTQVVAADAETAVVAGTDVLRVRGVFSTPLYQVLNAALEAPNLVFLPNAEDPASATEGAVVVRNPSPSGFRQDLQPLVDAAEHDALILVSPLSDAIYGVVSVKDAQVDFTDADGKPTQVTVNFRVTGGTYSAEYRQLYEATGNLPNNLTSAAFVGLVEEHVFYVREVFAIPGDQTSELQPKLARAQVFPRTAVATGDAETGRLDLADNILDLQVALGYNSDADGAFFTQAQLDDLVLSEAADGADDDWLFNGAGDDPTASPWEAIWGDPDAGGTPQPELYYLRITTLARTDGREFQYVAPPIASLEDRAYNEQMVPAVRDPEREFHRRLLRTVVDLRNL
jgi:prepilin-type N-terminal cleavage/methylation domain-containing protein